MKKDIFRGVIFLSILLIVISLVNPIFIKKVGHRAKLYQGLYNKDNNYDVLLFGSSHMNSSLNPNIFWDKYGITSFNYGTGGQPIDVTYYLMKEALKAHPNPEIVVVDLYYLGSTNEFGTEGYIRYVLDNMKFSLNKVAAVINCTPQKEWAYYIFPLAKYHDRWKELTYDDFTYDYNLLSYSKGFSAGREIYGIDNASNLYEIGVGNIPPKSEEYLYKIIELSKTNDFKLVFTNAPYDYTSTDASKSWCEDDAKMFNKVAVIAENYSIPFIDYSSKEVQDSINFNFAKDMFNIGHLNIWGSAKISSDFADFLHNNFELVDRRDDENYEQWNLDYKVYLEQLADLGL